MCLISGMNAKTPRLEFSSFLETKGSLHHYMGFSVLLLDKASPAPLRAKAEFPRDKEGREGAPSFLNIAIHGAEEHEQLQGLFVFLKL